MSNKSNKRGRPQWSPDHIDHRRVAWDISCTIYLMECSAVGSLRDGLDQVRNDWGFPHVPESLSRRKEDRKHPDFEKEIQASKNNAHRGYVSFYCKNCKRAVKYQEPNDGISSYLDCKCGCKCDCHTTRRWNKADCICQPCGICRVGAPGMPTNGPMASCGNQRLCHFGMRCRNKDTTCGFLHEE
jgi:hypothetical protein